MQENEMSDEELEELLAKKRGEFSRYSEKTADRNKLRMHRSLSEQVTKAHKSGLEKTRYRNQ